MDGGGWGEGGVREGRERGKGGHICGLRTGPLVVLKGHNILSQCG